MQVILKKHPTIGCCGIDCGLCPRYHTDSLSACPGCAGLNFNEKHPSCGFISCCVVNHGSEVCSSCPDFPCLRFVPEQQGYDSFVTHRKMFQNLAFIKENGLDYFLNLQKQRMDILTDFLQEYNDGRSKSLFCLSCALLPLEKLIELHRFMDRCITVVDKKEKTKLLKDRMQDLADKLQIDLKLNAKV